MPRKERNRRERELGHATFNHVVGAKPCWNAHPGAVALLLQAFGYPTTPPPIAPLAPDSCRFHVLP